MYTGVRKKKKSKIVLIKTAIIQNTLSCNQHDTINYKVLSILLKKL